MPHPPTSAKKVDASERIVGSEDDLPYRQMLGTILQFDACLRDFTEEHAVFRKHVQLQLGVLLEKMETMHTPLAIDEKNCEGNKKLSAAFEPVENLDEGNITAVESGKADSCPSSVAKDIDELHNRLSKLEEEEHWLVMHTKSPLFEYAMSCVIVISVLIMSVHMQWQGFSVAHKLGLRNTDAGYSDVEFAFELIEKLFAVLFLLEMLLRLFAFKRDFFRYIFNWLDASVILISCVETFMLRHNSDSWGVNLTVLRVLRSFRVLRIVKVVRFAEHLRELRILMRTLFMSVRGVFWSMLLVLGVIYSSATLISALVLPFMDDEDIPLEKRIFVYRLFGTVSRSFETMFESTFTGGWRFYTRPLYEDLSPFFCLFWIPYIVCVNFTLLRVIAALFLKQMFAVAEHDSERLAMEKMKERERFAVELKHIFKDFDSSGDGAISKDEFDVMLSLPTVANRFLKLDLEIDEVVALFSVLSADDGAADYEEFLNGALKMKSSARTIDTVQILHQQLAINRTIEDLRKGLEKHGYVNHKIAKAHEDIEYSMDTDKSAPPREKMLLFHTGRQLNRCRVSQSSQHSS